MQNQLKAGSFVGTNAGLSHYVQFFSYARAMKWMVLRWPYYLNARANQARFLLYLNKPSIALVTELGRSNVTFWLTSWTWFICALLKMFKECILVQRNLQHLGCLNHLEKLAEMFLNTFHREHILLKLKIKYLLRKIKSKNLTAGV